MPPAIYTRCPECSTVFRIAEQQLETAKGRVRCGACLNVFKAADHLVRPKSKSTGNTSKPEERPTRSPGESLEKLQHAHSSDESNLSQSDDVGFLKAHPSAELDIRNSGKSEKTQFPIDSFGQEDHPEKFAEQQDAAQNQDDASDKNHTTEATVSPDQADTETTEAFTQESAASETGSFEPDDEDIADFNDTSDDATEEPSSKPEASLTDTTWVDQQPNNETIDESHDPLSWETETSEKESHEVESQDIEPSSNESLDSLALENESRQPEIQNTEVLESSLDTALESEPGTDELDQTFIDDHDPFSDKEPETVKPKPRQQESASTDLDEQGTAMHDTTDDISIDTLNASLSGDSLEPDPLDEFDEIVEQKSHKYKWLAAIALLIVGFGWGISTLWSERQTLAWDDTWGSLVHTMCAVAPCDLQQRRDVDAIELLQRDIRPDQNDPNISEFKLMIRNNAAFEQPYPTVEIRFTDTQGNVVSTERHTPDNYLSEELKESLMPPNQQALIVIRARESHANAFGFEFNFQ